MSEKADVQGFTIGLIADCPFQCKCQVRTYAETMQDALIEELYKFKPTHVLRKCKHGFSWKVAWIIRDC